MMEILNKKPYYHLDFKSKDGAVIFFHGDWCIKQPVSGFLELKVELAQHSPKSLIVNVEKLGHWDALFAAFLFQCHQWCDNHKVTFDTSSLPKGAQNLLSLATAIKQHVPPTEPSPTFLEELYSGVWLKSVLIKIRDFINFVGEVYISAVRLTLGKSNTRLSDFLFFIEQSGPKALGIITLVSLLVGMILAYLSAVQLSQIGAQIYVANLVTLGMAREMGALMVGIIMSARTGAAYAAQLGTMQTNDEIDAITTMGISPMEFLVMPRLLALIVIMPLLCIYSIIIGIVGGAIVAAGMDVSLTQYITQTQSSAEIYQFVIGVFKSLIFAILIAIAGCQAGLACGRSSADVGLATTTAVVRSIVYIIIADATMNVIFDNLGL